MPMKKKVILWLVIIGLVCFGWIQFYYLPKIETADKLDQANKLEPETHQFSRVMKYENSYMGNAGNNINLINDLPMSEIPRLFEQDPNEFRLMVNYEKSVDEIGKERVEKALLYNATAVFALIKNMEVIDFNFVDKNYTITREQVNDWFGEDISSFNDEKMFEEKVQQPIKEQERLGEWIDSYTGGNS